MGRPPIFRKAMTKTQIQRRWRRNVRRKAKCAKQEQRRLAREAAASQNSKP
jgi:hypothetical protein